MSKTLLSRVKPHPPNSRRTHSPITPKIRKRVNDTVNILRTHQNLCVLLNEDEDDDEVRIVDISPYVFDRIHDVEIGVKLFDWLSNQRKEEFFSNGFACSSFLKLLARHRILDEIGDVLGNLRKENVKITHEALSHVLHAYAESGFLNKAMEIYNFVVESFDSVPDVIACNSLLGLLVKSRRLGDARKVYDEMRKRGGCVDNYSTCILLKGLCNEGKVGEGRKLIEDRWGKGCVPNIVFYNTIIGGYCKLGDIEKAKLVFNELKMKGFIPTLETFGTMINGFCKKGDFVGSDRLLKEAKDRGLRVSVWFLNNILDAKYRHGGCKMEPAESIRWIIDNGCKPDVVTYNTLINHLCKKGRKEDAARLLDEASKKGLVLSNKTYAPLVQAYCNSIEYDSASKLLLQMAETGCKPDIVTYGILINGLVVSGHMDDAIKMKDKLIERGISPDAAIYNMLMSGLCKNGRILPAKLLVSEMLDRDILPDAYVYATLIDGFIRSGDFDEARKVFTLSIEKGVKVDIVHHNAMIKGFCRSGMLTEALTCMDKMVEERLVPDQFTYSTIIDGYVKQQDMTTAMKIFRDMCKSKCKPNVVTYSSLVNGFCCQGDFEMAETTFEEMQSRGLVANVVTYTTLIKSFAKDGGNLGKAVYYWELMLRNNCVPNEITFNCLLEGFVKTTSGQVVVGFSEGQSSLFLEFFHRMKSDGWSDHAAAYNSVLVCLSVHGMVMTACRFQDRMVKKGFSPDAVSFAAILHGFCLVGNLKQWRSMNLRHPDEKGLEVALRYSSFLERHLPQAVTSQASSMLHTMTKRADSEELISVR